MLSRHSSTGKRRATHSRRPDAVKSSPKYAETTRRADVSVSGAGPKARQADLVRLRRHGFTGTLQARLNRTQLYRHGSIVARLDRHTCTLQARLYTGTALFRPGFIQARLYRHGFIQARLYRHSCAGTTLQARRFWRGSQGTPLQARLYRHAFTSTPLQAHFVQARLYTALKARPYRRGSTGTAL